METFKTDHSNADTMDYLNLFTLNTDKDSINRKQARFLIRQPSDEQQVAFDAINYNDRPLTQGSNGLMHHKSIIERNTNELRLKKPMDSNTTCKNC